MKTTFKILLFISITILFSSCSIFGAGTFLYAERYKIDASEEEVLKAVQIFKSQNPQYNPPDSITMHGRHLSNAFEEGRRGHYYFLYFYDKENKQIYLTWTRQSVPRIGEVETTPKTTFALYAIRTGFKLDIQAPQINNDFTRKENRYYKKRFEDLYLNKIKEIVAQNKKQKIWSISLTMQMYLTSIKHRLKIMELVLYM